MDFFEAQARAKQRTARLVALFAFAVLGIVVAGYAATLVFLGQVNGRMEAHGHGRFGYSLDTPPGGWWRPDIFACVASATILVVGIASLFKWFQLRGGGAAIAGMVGGVPVDPRTVDPKQRRLLNIVEEMSIASGVPMPAVFVLDDEPGINAFVAGLTASDAAVAVTRGALEKLDRDELQGVVAHEFSHILNGDMRLNVRIAAVVFGILVIGLIGRGILRSIGQVRVSSSRGDKNSGGGVIFAVAVGVVLLALGYIGYFFGRLIQAAVSRQREFLADASAVQFTRNPGGVTGALKKIGGYALGSDLRSGKAEQIGHFFFAQGFRSVLGGAWATHPPLDIRIRAIDASFDGKFFEPPAIVDVNYRTWDDRMRAVDPVPRATAPAAPHPLAVAASAGVLDSVHIARAQALAETIPASLRDSVRTPTGASAVACGLLLDADEAPRARQRNLVRGHGGDTLADTLAPLEAALVSLPREARLPLLLLAPPALRELPAADLARLLETLDELVHADGRVDLSEFALQKALARHLALGADPGAARETLGLPEVSGDISLLLSFAARLRPEDAAVVPAAFNTGASRFSGLYPPLALRDPATCTLPRLDIALDRLARAYGPVKKRALDALAATLGHDGRYDVEEVELLRSVSSALDCPMPLAF